MGLDYYPVSSQSLCFVQSLVRVVYESFRGHASNKLSYPRAEGNPVPAIIPENGFVQPDPDTIEALSSSFQRSIGENH